MFILNQAGWRQLYVASKEKMESPANLLKHGPKNVILTKGFEGCEIFSVDRRLEIPVLPQLRARFKTVDPTGAGDGFSAGLIKVLLSNWSLSKAAAYGQIVASVTCSQVGTSNAFPTKRPTADRSTT